MAIYSGRSGDIISGDTQMATTNITSWTLNVTQEIFDTTGYFGAGIRKPTGGHVAWGGTYNTLLDTVVTTRRAGKRKTRVFAGFQTGNFPTTGESFEGWIIITGSTVNIQSDGTASMTTSFTGEGGLEMFVSG